jgi:GNAT superfamily N-acetyltransferase
MSLEVRIEPASVEDAAEILDLQKLAYQSEAALHDEYRIPPLTQTLADMQAEFGRQVVLKASAGGRIVGSVRGHVQDGTGYVGRLIVHPDVQNQGLGTRLMAEIEAVLTRAHRFELFTGHKSERNLYLYRKLGYRPFKEEKVGERLTLVYLEKQNPAGKPGGGQG